MNKTIITKKIDEFEIVVGFGNLTIDPEATKEIVTPLLEKSEEVAAVLSKKEEMNAVSKSRIESIKAAKEAKKAGNKSLEAQHSYNVELKTEQLSTFNSELVVLLSAAAKKKTELWENNLVYFEPKSGETLPEDETLEETFSLLSSKQLLASDGTVIDDKRGIKYVKDGKICEVSALGEEPDGPLLDSITAEEFEKLRVEAMTEEEKQSEYDSMDDSLASQAANMKAMLEIKNDPDAEAKAKAFYSEGLVKLKEKYGIS